MSTGFPTAVQNQVLGAHPTRRHSPHWSTPESPAQQPPSHHHPPRRPNPTTDVCRGGPPRHHRAVPPHRASAPPDRRTAGPRHRATASRRTQCCSVDFVKPPIMLKRFTMTGGFSKSSPAGAIGPHRHTRSQPPAPRRAATASLRRRTEPPRYGAGPDRPRYGSPPDRPRYGAADVTEGEKSGGRWRTRGRSVQLG